MEQTHLHLGFLLLQEAVAEMGHLLVLLAALVVVVAMQVEVVLELLDRDMQEAQASIQTHTHQELVEGQEALAAMLTTRDITEVLEALEPLHLLIGHLLHLLV